MSGFKYEHIDLDPDKPSWDKTKRSLIRIKDPISGISKEAVFPSSEGGIARYDRLLRELEAEIAIHGMIGE